MRRNTKIIQITGFRGLFMVIFITVCLAAGFIAFPAIVAMNIWNYAAQFMPIPMINGLQGLLLWAITAITVFIINDRNKFLVAFSNKKQLSDAELQNILEKVRKQAHTETINSMVLKTQDKEEKVEETEKKGSL